MIRRMQIKDVHCIRAQLLQARERMLLQPVGLMHASLVWIHLRGEREPAVFPFGVARPGFLLSAYVDARCVDLVVGLGLEVVEAFCEV